MHKSLRLVPLLCIVLVFAVRTLVIANAPEAMPHRSLDGIWQADISDDQAVVLSINDSDIELSLATGEKRSVLWVGKLSISKDEPNQHMDWVELRSGNTRLPDNKCLFRLRGDLLLVIGGGPNERPTKFLSGPGADPKTLAFIRTTAKNEGDEDAKPELPNAAF